MTTLPLDSQGFPLPTLGYVDGGAKIVTISSTSARTSTAISNGTRVVSLYATSACFLRLGDNTTTATTTDHYIPSGLYQDVAIGPDSKDRYIAVIRAEGVDGTLYVSERQ